MKSFYQYVIAIALLATFSCKKESTSTIAVNASNSGGTVQVTKGQTIILTLVNTGGDDGYIANNPQFNSSVLKLISHVYAPASSGKVGAGGTDTWQLSSLQTGSTSLVVTASRGQDDVQTEFNGTINVK